MATSSDSVTMRPHGRVMAISFDCIIVRSSHRVLIPCFDRTMMKLLDLIITRS